jgi:hypothetical protein
MIRALSILAAVAALAVAAAPALAATSKKPPHGTARVGGKMHLEDTSLSLTSFKPKPLAEGVTEELFGPSSGSVGFKRHGAAKAPATTQLHTFSGDAYVNEMG